MLLIPLAAYGAKYFDDVFSSTFRSNGSNIATSGVFRLANTETIGWRNNANNGNLLLSVDSSDRLLFNGVLLPSLASSSFTDNGFFIVDDGDSTKKLAFQSSGISTGTTRTLTVPDLSGTIALTSGAQTFTSKTIDGDDNTVQDLPVTALKTNVAYAFGFLSFNGSGVPGATKAVPNGVVVGDTDTQTLTNKTLTSPTINTPTTDVVTWDDQASTPSNPASGYYKSYFKSDGKLYKLNSGGVETEIGSGSGGAGTNDKREYISNGKAETDATGWSTYADAAATSPVDGTGGSPNVTVARTTTSSEIIRETASFKLAKDAANRQGQGVSYDFTVDPHDYKASRAVVISFDYKTTANYASDDIIVSVYDKDAATLLPCYPSNGTDSTGKVKAATNGTRFLCTFFPTTITSDDYRLIFHVATTNATAYDFIFDAVHAGPDSPIPGALMVDLGTQAWTDNQTNATTSVRVQREGSYVYITGEITWTGAGSSNLQITIPTEYTGDAGIYNFAGGTIHYPVGIAMMQDTSAGAYRHGEVNLVSNVNLLNIYLYDSSGTYANLTNPDATTPWTWASGDKVTFHAKWRVSNWAATTAVSSAEATFSTIKVRYETAAGQSIPNNSATIVDFGTKIKDDYNAVTTGSSWKFTASKSGQVFVNASALFTASSAWAANEYMRLFVYKNGVAQPYLCTKVAESSTASLNLGCNGSMTVSMSAGDYIDVRAIQTSGGSLALASDNNANYVDIFFLPDFSTFGIVPGGPPTVTLLTSGTGATYTKPPAARYLKIRMVGGGGGGGGSGTAGGSAGATGGNTTFGSSLLTANGGTGGAGPGSAAGGTGGSVSVNSPAVGIVSMQGAPGGGAGFNQTANAAQLPGAAGGNSPFGGAGQNGYSGGGAAQSPTGYGSGGASGGGASTASHYTGGGGASGGYIEALITNPSATYTYTVGTAGGGGTAGTNGSTGYDGKAGVIIVEEYY